MNNQDEDGTMENNWPNSNYKFAQEKLREASSFDIVKGMAGCVDYIKMCKKVLSERGFNGEFSEKFLKTWNGRNINGE